MVQVIQIDVVGAKAAQAVLAGAEDVEARGAIVVGAGTHALGHLRRNQHVVAPALDGLAQYLLRKAQRVSVRSVEHVDAGFEAEVHHARGFGDVDGAPGTKELRAAAEGRRTEGEYGDFEARVSEQSIFHRGVLSDSS